jgi:SPP1 gp7 family putative phage head morphogenesis protein
MDRVEANVALAMGVRPEVLGYLVGLKNSPWSHMETARKITYEDSIEPLWRRQEKTLTRQLLPQADQDARRFIRFDTSGVRALQEDEERRAKIARSNADIWTVGERRIYTGKDPFGDERDEEITSSPAPVAPMQQMAEPVAWETKDAGTRNIRWLQFDLDAKAQEPGWEREVLSLLVLQAKGIRELFERYVLAVGGEPTPESLASFLGAVSEYLSAEGKAEAARILTPLVQSTAERSARRVTARLGWSFDVVQEGLAKYITEEVDFLVSVMGETTGRAVAETVQSALVDRVPLTELRSRLETLPAFDRKRAQLVARTETTRATNGAQRRTVEEGARELGVTTQKTWLSSRDDRVRDEHDMRDDGEWYGMDHTWGGLKEPGEPNCRCTLDYRVVPSEPQPTGATL